MNEISFQKGLESLNGAGSALKTTPKETPEQASFGSMLANSLNDVNRLKQEADVAVENLATGNQKDIHSTMIALEKADVAFQLLMQVRNKIIAAYETVMRMQA
jgi:flagellar hook-basal body complex protein FliE